MTALDEGPGSSATLVIQVKKEPFSFGVMMADYGIYIGLLGLIVILVTLLVQRVRSPESDIKAPRVESVGRDRSRRVSMDDAFDDPDYDPFDTEKKGLGASKSMTEADPDLPSEAPEEPESVDSELADSFNELAEESLEGEIDEEDASGADAVSVDDALDNEDIEALFDD